MGQEVACTLTLRRRAIEGIALLESDHILFRGGERIKIALRQVTGVKASGGVLRLDCPDGPAELQLGPAAEKWAHKILHPPSRVDKLGVKPGQSISVSGRFDPDFLRELGRARPRPVKESDLIFLAAEDRAALDKAKALVPYLKPSGALWVVYPKGVQAITQDDVFRVLRDAGLKDTKVASFSSTHTALKFVIPAAKRSSGARR